MAGGSVCAMVIGDRCVSRVVPVGSRPGDASRGNHDIRHLSRERWCESHLASVKPRPDEYRLKGDRNACAGAQRDRSLRRQGIQSVSTTRVAAEAINRMHVADLAARLELEHRGDDTAGRNDMVVQWGRCKQRQQVLDQPLPPACPDC